MAHARAGPACRVLGASVDGDPVPPFVELPVLNVFPTASAAPFTACTVSVRPLAAFWMPFAALETLLLVCEAQPAPMTSTESRAATTPTPLPRLDSRPTFFCSPILSSSRFAAFSTSTVKFPFSHLATRPLTAHDISKNQLIPHRSGARDWSQLPKYSLTRTRVPRRARLACEPPVCLRAGAFRSCRSGPMPLGH